MQNVNLQGFFTPKWFHKDNQISADLTGHSSQWADLQSYLLSENDEKKNKLALPKANMHHRKLTWNLQNTPLKKEKHLQNPLIFVGSMLGPPGVFGFFPWNF